jgi:hypothetical protein
MPEGQFPQEVVDELRERCVRPVSVSKTMDEAILADAQAVLQDGRRPNRVQPLRRNWTFGLVSVGSLAAALLIAATSQWHLSDVDRVAAPFVAEYAMDTAESVSGPDSRGSVSALYQREDIDRSGNVDILDAFALARRVRRSDAGLVTGDQNGDGVVNDADVELIAMNAVML